MNLWVDGTVYGALKSGFTNRTVVLLRDFSITATASCLGVDTLYFPSLHQHTHPCHSVPHCGSRALQQSTHVHVVCLPARFLAFSLWTISLGTVVSIREGRAASKQDSTMLPSLSAHFELQSIKWRDSFCMPPMSTSSHPTSLSCIPSFVGFLRISL